MQPDNDANGGPSPCTDPRYGRDPKTREAVCAFAAEIGKILETRPRGEIAAAVAAAMEPMLRQSDLLAEAHCLCQPETYRRHILFADPDRRFTILALVWRPGQETPIHGHRAWGAVGVYEGEPTVTIYDCTEVEGGGRAACLQSELRCAPGDTTFVQPGYGDVHRICNATEDRVLTIHVYGRDLVEDPSSINLLVSA